MNYRIKLQNFEGPLDLLLFFISRDKINIYDIPIYRITDEFFKYIEMMKQLKIEVAGEFILMASMLMRIKSRMLLPKRVNDDEDHIDDPRVDLVKQLLEYKQFKEARDKLEKIQNNHNIHHPRGRKEEIEYQKEDISEVMRDVKLIDLLVIFDKLIKNLPEKNIYELKIEEYSVSEELKKIRQKFLHIKNISFIKLFKGKVTKLNVVITFIAILELIQNKELILMQDNIFGDIKLKANF